MQKFMNEGKDVSSIDIPTNTIKALTHQMRNAAYGKLYLTLHPGECKLLVKEINAMQKELKELREAKEEPNE